MTIDDYYAKIKELSDSSSVVAQYLSAQYYRLEYDTEDEIDIPKLMKNCYVIIIGELKELGIDLFIDIEDAIENTYQADGYVALYKFLEKDNLVSKLRIYQNIIPAIEEVLENDSDGQSLIQDFIDVYTDYNPYEATLEPINRVLDTIVSNELLVNHLKVVLKLSVPIATIDDTNIEKITEYVKKIYLGKEVFAKIIKKMIFDHNDTSVSQKYLKQICDTYDVDKVTGTDIAKFCWAVMLDQDTASDSEKKLAESILYQHQIHQTHHIEYYLANKVHPTKENLIELTVHHAEPDSTREEFEEEVNKMIQKSESSDFKPFTEEDKVKIEYIKTSVINMCYVNEQKILTI